MPDARLPPKLQAAKLILTLNDFLDGPDYTTWAALRAAIEQLKPPAPPLDPPAPYDERYAVRDPAVERALYGIGSKLRETMPDGWGFVLLLASVGKAGATFYMSSVQRADAMKLLQEFLDRERAQPSPNIAPGAE